MILVSLHTISFKHINQLSVLKFLNLSFLLFLLIFFSLFTGCSSSKRYTIETEIPTRIELNETAIRVLIDEAETSTFLTLQSPVYLYNGTKKLAIIHPGNTIECYNSSDEITVKIESKKFTDKYFHLESANNSYINFNGKSYNGSLKLTATDNFIEVVNYIDLEDYLKGVISKEMPLGVGTENLEALKALTICARTYATLRMQEGKSIYDIFDDTRAQMYGGKDAESPLSDRAVEETSGMILSYANEPAVVFYSSTCGWHTAAVHNVFTNEEYPYLQCVADGNEPYCKISSRYQWEEIYSKDLLIDRLIDAALIKDDSYNFEEISINSKFDCGRVDELEILLEDLDGEEISVKIYGNDIRGVLHTGDGKSDLWSTLFDISDEGDKIIIDGNGYGHGVGLCQWGAIYLSQEGWNYEDILEHYFPGTSVWKVND